MVMLSSSLYFSEKVIQIKPQLHGQGAKDTLDNGMINVFQWGCEYHNMLLFFNLIFILSLLEKMGQ